MNIMLNLSWACNQRPPCPYCWVETVSRLTKLERTRSRYHSWREWVVAINTVLPEGKIDFVGGEPTIFPGFVRILTYLPDDRMWALTTNLLNLEVIEEIASYRFGNLIGITCSFHPHSRLISLDDFIGRMILLRNAGYFVSVNVVDYRLTLEARKAISYIRQHEFEVHISPYEHPPDVSQKHSLRLCCKGGYNHCVVDPQGNLYPCLTAFRHPQRSEFSFGNIFHGQIKWPTGQTGCTLWCEQYFILAHKHHAKDMFDLQVRICE